MNDFTNSLLYLGWNDRWAALLDEVRVPEGTPVPGRVIRRDRGWALVATGTSVLSVEVANHPVEIVTGDWIALAGERLVEVLPRKGLLRRKDNSGSEQLLAANVDVVLLVCGLDRPVKPGRVHRGAVQARDAGAQAVVVLNKADLCPDPQAAAALIAAQTLGLEVLTVSTRTGEGLDALRSVFGGRTAVLLGESGAGKTSLLNALAGRHIGAEGAVRAGDAKGRHTTTRRELHHVTGTGVVIDTPGIRTLGLAASSEAVGAAFEDIDNLAHECRFPDCAHGTEPGCAARQAVEEGRLPETRLEVYLGLLRELEGEVIRANPYERRRQERKFSRLAREGQKAKQARALHKNL